MAENKTVGSNLVQSIQLPAAVLKALMEGRVVFYGEFRRGLAVEFSGKGGKLFHQSKCSVETETGTITVTEFLADGVDWKAWQAPFVKGTMIYCVCRGLEESSGVLVASGKMFAV
jgi:hypothetical protein